MVPVSNMESYLSERSFAMLHLYFVAVILVIVVFGILICVRCKKEKKKNSVKSPAASSALMRTAPSPLQEINGENQQIKLHDESKKLIRHTRNGSTKNTFHFSDKPEKSLLIQLPQTPNQESKSSAAKSVSVKVVKTNGVVNKEKSVTKVNVAESDAKLGTKSTLHKSAKSVVDKSKKEPSVFEQNKSTTILATTTVQPSRAAESKHSPPIEIFPTEYAATTNQIPKTPQTPSISSPIVTAPEPQYTQEIAPKYIDGQIGNVVDPNKENEISALPKLEKITNDAQLNVDSQPEFKLDHTYYGVPMHMDME